MNPRIKSCLQFLLLLFMFLSAGTIESSGIGVRHVTLLQKGSVKENSRKLLGVNGLFDYDYAGPNPKHGKKGGGGTKTPSLS